MEPSPRLPARAGTFKEVGDFFSALGQALSIPPRRGTPEPTGDRSPSPKGLRVDTQLELRAPSTSLLARKQQIVVGVLLKYVNLGSGWRQRLFVLQDGVLRYYKVYGPTAVNVYQLMEALRQQGELDLIGAEVQLLESRDRRVAAAAGASPSSVPWAAAPSPGSNSASLLSARSPGPGSSGKALLPVPQGEMHLQVSSLRESNADPRKFYVNTGMQTVSLRAETKEDRWVWMSALRASKVSWEGRTPTEASALRCSDSSRVLDGDSAFLGRLAEVRGALQTRGADDATLDYVEDVLTQEHQRLHEMLLTEESKRKALLDIIYSLENDKRQLETAMVVEGGVRQHACKRGGAGGHVSGVEADAAASESDERGTVEEDEEGRDSLGVAGGEEEEGEITDDEFFECETASLTSAHSRNQSLDLASFQALPEGQQQALAGGAMQARSGTRAPQPPQPQQQQPPAQQQQQPSTGTGAAGALAVAASAGGARAAAAGSAEPAAAGAGAASPSSNGEPQWLQEAMPPPPRRDRLPQPAQQERSVSLWSLIKDMVGRDLTRVCLPVYFNEPLSALQKSAEDLEYCEILDVAAELPQGSTERLLRVAAFAVSAYSSTIGRTAKPFNPLLGETYEFLCPEKGFRFIAEKVVHHPTVVAAHCEGRRWVFEGDAEVKSKFWGRSIELHPEGLLRLRFSDGDTYCWNKVVTSINNLILGKIYIDHGGIMKVRQLATGLTARIRFKETGLLFDKDPRQVRGYLEQGTTKFERPLLHGHWDDTLHADMPDGTQVLLWSKNPPPPDPTRYNLTLFAIQLNELTPGLDKVVAPTDCRLRPDQHALELGQYDEANAEKQRLEHKQRAARKAAERGDPIRPRWFDVVPASNLAKEEGAFRYKGGYWEERAEGHFTGCRDIFGQHVMTTE